jgi:hypothetical protein
MSEVKDQFKAIIKEQILRLEMTLEQETNEEEELKRDEIVLLQQQINALKELLSV